MIGRKASNDAGFSPIGNFSGQEKGTFHTFFTGGAVDAEIALGIEKIKRVAE